jgi:CHASE3 domain sensor protein
MVEHRQQRSVIPQDIQDAAGLPRQTELRPSYRLAELRAGLANRTERERSLESQLEPAAGSKQAEMERTISLRQQGYRRRAFNLVDTNEGRDYMDGARKLVSSLSSRLKPATPRF